MCIALISTAHPSYSLIIVDNRDEFLRRPTSTADWWPGPNSHVLGSRDLARAAQGTWMGVTKQGKIAVLTNYRESKCAQACGPHSRGTIVNSWLTGPPDHRRPTREFAEEMISSSAVQTVGGFSLVCGYINEPLAIISNRSAKVENIMWVATGQGQTIGLSNTAFVDRSWPKILDGEKLMEAAIRDHVEAGEDEECLIRRLLRVLSTDTLPRVGDDGNGMEAYIPLLRKSIFIPIICAADGTRADAAADVQAAVCVTEELEESTAPAVHDPIDHTYLQGAYGTQKQTVILVSDSGRVRYFERTLYDQDVTPIPIGQGDRSFEFVVQQ